jgi:aminopeptidase N
VKEMRFIFFVILLQLLTFVVGAIPNKYRLPRGISVSKYEIEITPYFEDIGSNAAFTFDGKVVITLSTTWTNVSAIILHASNLDVKSLVLQNGDTTIPTNPFGHEVDTDKLIIRLDENLEENVNYTLTMQYIGKLEDNLRGFYRSSYIEESGKKWLGTTQFQPSDARSAFPCFDEPGFKSVFQVTINRPKSFSISLANTRLKESKDHETL